MQSSEQLARAPGLAGVRCRETLHNPARVPWWRRLSPACSLLSLPFSSSAGAESPSRLRNLPEDARRGWHIFIGSALRAIATGNYALAGIDGAAGWLFAAPSDHCPPPGPGRAPMCLLSSLTTFAFTLIPSSAVFASQQRVGCVGSCRVAAGIPICRDGHSLKNRRNPTQPYIPYTERPGRARPW